MSNSGTIRVFVEPKLLNKIDDIAHFYHLSRCDWIRLQLARAVAQEKRLNKTKVLSINTMCSRGE